MTVRAQSLKIAFSVVVVYAIDVVDLQLTFPYDSRSTSESQPAVSVLAVVFSVNKILIATHSVVCHVVSVTASTTYHRTVHAIVPGMLSQSCAARFTTDSLTHARLFFAQCSTSIHDLGVVSTV